MSELTFEQMLEESLKTIHAGEVVEGTVIDVKPDEIVLNIGYKSDGILTKSEYSNDQSLDLTTVAKVGDTMEVRILKVNDGSWLRSHPSGVLVYFHRRRTDEPKSK